MTEKPNLQLHIELTSACNSGCLDCNRFIKKTDILNPSVEIEWFTMDMMKNVFDDEMVKKVANVNFTGTYGESSLHPQFFEFLDFIAERVPHKVKIMMESNGGTHKPEWWEKLGKVLKEKFREDSFVVFALDGIDDETHQKYRRGVKWEKVIENAKAFSKNARTIWQMIEFEHNKHQFEEAKLMAESFGWEFKKRRSRLRFVGSAHGKVFNDKVEIKPTETKRKRYSKETLNASESDRTKVEAVLSSVSGDYQNETEIICEWKKKNQVSIDYDGVVWQCCYFSTFLHPDFEMNNDSHNYNLNVEQRILHQMKKENMLWYEQRYELDWNNIRFKTLSDVLSHEFFNHDLPKSFGNRLDSPEFPRIKRCAKHCGSASRKIEELIHVEK